MIDRIFGGLALVGLSAAAIVHVAALRGIDIGSRFPVIWIILFLGIPIVFVPFVFRYQRAMGSRPTLSEIRDAFPDWVIFVAVFFAIYAWVGFWAGAAPQPTSGVPTKRDNKFVIANHGTIIREISESEYHSLEVSNLRGISSLWLVFYFLPCAYFVFRNKALR